MTINLTWRKYGNHLPCTIMWFIMISMLLLLNACSHCELSFNPESEYAHTGPYIGAGLSLVDENFTAFENVGHNADEVKPGVNLKAGYRFSPGFATEIVFQKYSPFDVTIASSEDGTIRGSGWTVNLKYFWATGRIQPYIFAGAGYGHTKNSSGIGANGAGEMGAVGLGVDYYLYYNLLLFLEAASYKPWANTNEFGFRPVTTGLQYRF